MRRRPATDRDEADAIAAFNAFVELWNRTPREQRHVVFTRTHQVAAAGLFAGEFDEEYQKLNPDVRWPIEPLNGDTALRRGRPRAAVPGHREHQFVRFAL